mmetsp:Transcript_4641/g.16617  ORF Transcript_4641/g.16617 Transcript_4641/m.16617 type:complete len:427 (+) Transcript_4641:1244-2524(+)
MRRLQWCTAPAGPCLDAALRVRRVVKGLLAPGLAAVAPPGLGASLAARGRGGGQGGAVHDAPQLLPLEVDAQRTGCGARCAGPHLLCAWNVLRVQLEPPRVVLVPGPPCRYLPSLLTVRIVRRLAAAQAPRTAGALSAQPPPLPGLVLLLDVHGLDDVAHAERVVARVHQVGVHEQLVPRGQVQVCRGGPGPQLEQCAAGALINDHHRLVRHLRTRLQRLRQRASRLHAAVTLPWLAQPGHLLRARPAQQVHAGPRLLLLLPLSLEGAQKGRHRRVALLPQPALARLRVHAQGKARPRHLPLCVRAAGSQLATLMMLLGCGGALLVTPVCRQAILRNVVHVNGADLHLQRQARGGDGGGVDGLVPVQLWTPNVVLQPALDGREELLHHAQRGVAVALVLEDDAQSALVQDLVRLEALVAHLRPHGV